MDKTLRTYYDNLYKQHNDLQRYMGLKKMLFTLLCPNNNKEKFSVLATHFRSSLEVGKLKDW